MRGRCESAQSTAEASRPAYSPAVPPKWRAASTAFVPWHQPTPFQAKALAVNASGSCFRISEKTQAPDAGFLPPHGSTTGAPELFRVPCSSIGTPVKIDVQFGAESVGYPHRATT